MGIVANEKTAMMTTSDIDIWHKRLGHTSDSKLYKVDFLRNVYFNNRNNVCYSYVKSKRLPFPVSSIKNVDCFELIHCDI